MLEEKQKELSDTDIKKILVRQFQSIGMKETDITQELIDMRRAVLASRATLRAYNCFKKGKKTEKRRR